MFFTGAAQHLSESGYEDACPIATVALEGAFVLSRAWRSTEPLEVAGKTMATVVGAALDRC